MSPLQERVGKSWLRIIIGIFAGGLGVSGITADSELGKALTVVVTAAGGFIWSYISANYTQKKLLVLASNPNIQTEEMAEEAIKSGAKVDTSTPKDIKPVIK